MRVILDTNILLSGLIAPAGVPGRLIDAWLDRRFTLVSHSLQLDEFRAVSRRDKIRALVRPPEAGRLVNQIAALAQMPERLPPVERSRDPRDDFLLALCEAGAADRLVTGDKDDLLVLQRHGAAAIVSAAAFAIELGI
ncbi:putative toxin-antitoxin system toxin component, PIN family [uncultured Sphingomonas sp.]|uniref:putative toxin-antitoxin system toxin component, PIN family n=1 Tax=uncultured Sphingomonas sp. TaxID=158754 RepID=UPI0035CB459D